MTIVLAEAICKKACVSFNELKWNKSITKTKPQSKTDDILIISSTSITTEIDRKLRLSVTIEFGNGVVVTTLSQNKLISPGVYKKSPITFVALYESDMNITSNPICITYNPKTDMVFIYISHSSGCVSFSIYNNRFDSTGAKKRKRTFNMFALNF